jgi:hypothetical protein
MELTMGALGGVLTTIEMARMLQKQSAVRADFLAPLSGISETCWQIMLELYQGCELEQLYASLRTTPVRLNRYMAVMTQHGYIELDNETGGYKLSRHAQNSLEQILSQMIQDIS